MCQRKARREPLRFIVTITRPLVPQISVSTLLRFFSLAASASSHTRTFSVHAEREIVCVTKEKRETRKVGRMSPPARSPFNKSALFSLWLHGFSLATAQSSTRKNRQQRRELEERRDSPTDRSINRSLLTKEGEEEMRVFKKRVSE
mmetsp:Transcript_29636/g.58148  ORF Transcript_29636/g.58148 Transcript_29636/m.58148 type:complete len:146 (+) Transcript_29636:698-1135(+)